MITTKQAPPKEIDVPIVHIIYKLYCFWNELLHKFPKTQRYTLGQKCDVYILNLLEHTILCSNIKDRNKKLSHLEIASAKLDVLKLLIRISKDTKCISNVQYLNIQSLINEIGKMIGGWLKYLK